MYRFNNLKRDLLITHDEVLFHAATDQKIDERTINQNIIVAEERWIANALGDLFYDDFITKKNVKVTAENKAELLQKINESFALDGIEPTEESALKIGMIINAIELVDNEWYQKLWNRFLWKLTAECVDMMAIIPSWLRTTDVGQQLNNPAVIGGNNGASASGNRGDVQMKVTSAIQDRIDPLIERMRLWICQNKEHFPLYTKECVDSGCNGGDQNADGVSYLRKTNFITGIYDN
jgi:hypothetical protein